MLGEVLCLVKLLKVAALGEGAAVGDVAVLGEVVLCFVRFCVW